MLKQHILHVLKNILNSPLHHCIVFSQVKIINNSYFYIEKWTFKVMCEVYFQAKRDKKEAT